MSKQIDKWKSGLAKTKTTSFGRIANLLGMSEINSQTWENLEAALIQADLGLETAISLITALQDQAKTQAWTKSQQVQDQLYLKLSDLIINAPAFELEQIAPTVILIVGVNGSGKTTSVAKLGKRFKDQGNLVIFAAADTFRAAAIEQLQAWGARFDIRVIAGKHEGDAGAVAYDAIQSALAKKTDVVLIDTAGRMHTRYNLMEELKKIRKVISKSLPGAPHAVWLVMDATTGQNAMQQAKAFKQAVDVDGIILAKLDSSARGGMVFSIQKELGIPIFYAGLGEGVDDLEPFSKDAYIAGVLSQTE